MDDGWNFSRLARRHLLHWHPSLKPNCFLLSKYFEQFEKEPEVLPWPRVVDDDVFSGIIANYEATEELEDLNQLMIKQLKNRYNDPTGKNKKFVIGVDRAKMRLYDVEDTAQTLNVDEPPKTNQYEDFNV